MPTVILKINNTQDDSYIAGSTFYNSSSTLEIGVSRFTMFRFSNVNIPKGATINSATLKICAGQNYSINSNPVNISIGGELKANATSYSSSSSFFSSYICTVNYASYSITENWVSDNWYSYSGFQAAIKEIIDLPDWKSGNALMILIAGGNNFRKIKDYSSGATYGSELIIDYSTTSSIPTVNLVSYSVNKISAISGKDICTVLFNCNQDIQQWEARADGNGVGQGLLVGSGGTVSANTNISFDIENEELTWGDKLYRINIYVKNLNGDWNIYE